MHASCVLTSVWVQQSSEWSRTRLLNVNELLNVMALFTELGRDPSIQEKLHIQKRTGSLLLPSIRAKLVPADRCLHILTAPDSLKQRCPPCSPLPHLLSSPHPLLNHPTWTAFPGFALQSIRFSLLWPILARW